jgi:hypothetical protein
MSLVKRVAPAATKEYFGRIQQRLDKLEQQSALIAAQQQTIGMLYATIDAITSLPRYAPGDDVGFNGQSFRKKIFQEIVAAVPFVAIVETGTWYGGTTGYMASTARLPVFSCELNPRFHAIARQVLVDFPGITLRLSDSRRFLSDLANEPVLAGSPLFIYLDAHWYADLPLKEEVTLIMNNWRHFVIMVDDFQVPGDEGYGYDAYGEGKALTMEYLAEPMQTGRLRAYFPSAPSSEETGHRRGSVILASTDYASVLDALPSLKRA